MKRHIKVFFDSDVVISSFLSNKGAAYELLKRREIYPIITDISQKEILKSAKKLSLNHYQLKIHLKKYFKQISLPVKLEFIKKQYGNFVSDVNDAHIVKGAIESKAKFILTYNKRHFSLEKIKKNLKISTITPGDFLQYLRNLNQIN